ncbi:MAG: hypothetical protein UV42_C0025G0001, partial [Candidatus Magasanikbacteria bacterium GW2011_GWE2_42_7]
SYSLGVADTYTTSSIRASNSSKRSGRLSRALGNLNPFSTKESFRARS